MIKIILYAFDYLCSLAFSVFTLKPFVRKCGMLSVIASPNAMTQRHNIFRNITTALALWYPMSLSQCMPKSTWFSAYRTAVPEIFKTFDPVLFRKGSGQVSFLRFPSLVSNAPPLFDFGSLPVSFTGIANPMRVIAVVLALSLSELLRIIDAIILLVFLNCNRCSLVALPRFGSEAIPTWIAYALTAIGSVAEELFCPRLSLSATGALVMGNRLIDHSAFTSHCLPDVLSASDGKNRCSGATLADTFIIPRKRGIYA